MEIIKPFTIAYNSREVSEEEFIGDQILNREFQVEIITIGGIGNLAASPDKL